MRIGVIERTRMLIEAARAVAADDHQIAFVQTCRAEAHYDATEEDFRALAREVDAPFFGSPRTSDMAAIWAAERPDVAISINWPSMIKAATRDVARYGVLNAHAGDLPRYRGNACPNWRS